MTEWTMDMDVSDPDAFDTLRIGRLLETAPEDTFYRDLIADTIIEDEELDRADWFE